LSRCKSKFRIISSKGLPVGAAEKSNRQSIPSKQNHQNAVLRPNTTLRVIPLLKLVCARVLFFPARAWSINMKTLLLRPAGSEKERSKPPSNGERPAGLPLITLFLAC